MPAHCTALISTPTTLDHDGPNRSLRLAVHGSNCSKRDISSYFIRRFRYFPTFNCQNSQFFNCDNIMSICAGNTTRWCVVWAGDGWPPIAPSIEGKRHLSYKVKWPKLFHVWDCIEFLLCQRNVGKLEVLVCDVWIHLFVMLMKFDTQVDDDRLQLQQRCRQLVSVAGTSRPGGANGKLKSILEHPELEEYEVHLSRLADLSYSSHLYGERMLALCMCICIYVVWLGATCLYASVYCTCAYASMHYTCMHICTVHVYMYVCAYALCVVEEGHFWIATSNTEYAIKIWPKEVFIRMVARHWRVENLGVSNCACTLQWYDDVFDTFLLYVWY